MLWFASLIHWMKNFAPISQPKPLRPKPITACRELVTRAFQCLDQTSVFDLTSDAGRCYSTLARLRMSVSNMERFPFNQNFRKFGNSGKWYRNFSEKFPEIPETSEFSKCKQFNRKFREEIWMERKLPGKFFENFGYSSRGCPLFWKIWKMLFHSLLEVAENSHWTFWLNGTRPKDVYHLHKVSRKFGLKVNGTRLFESFQWKISGSNESSEKVVLFFQTECLNGNSCSIY